ncbi:MAG: F0F1 ATP synthase subunit delta [Candidatus Cloacimonetes bacterium]|nr:F0F1 ATP synthase subunit delta [Candidatus Cloacimonadota bacterium]
MKIRLLARRYAQAFIDNISERDFDTIFDDIKTIRSFIEEYPQIVKILQSILTPKKKKIELLDALAAENQSEGLALKQRKYWRGLLNVLIVKHRIQILVETIDEIERLLLQRQNKAKITLFLSREHASDVAKKVIDYVSNITGKELIPQTVINPDIIGGFVATVDSLRVDGSVKHNLEKFKKVKKS